MDFRCVERRRTNGWDFVCRIHFVHGRGIYREYRRVHGKRFVDDVRPSFCLRWLKMELALVLQMAQFFVCDLAEECHAIRQSINLKPVRNHGKFRAQRLPVVPPSPRVNNRSRSFCSALSRYMKKFRLFRRARIEFIFGDESGIVRFLSKESGTDSMGLVRLRENFTEKNAPRV